MSSATFFKHCDTLLQKKISNEVKTRNQNHDFVTSLFFEFFTSDLSWSNDDVS